MTDIHSKNKKQGKPSDKESEFIMSITSETISTKQIIEATHAPLTGTESFYKDFSDYMLSPEDIKAFRVSSSFANTNKPWGELSIRNPSSFGYLINSAEYMTRWDKVPTLEDFYEHTEREFKTRNKADEGVSRKPWSEVGTGEEWIPYFIRRAKQWNDYRPEQVRAEVSFTEVFIRIIQQSWEGLLSEMIVKATIKENLHYLEQYGGLPEGGLEMREPTKTEDYQYNCDIIMWDTVNDRRAFGVQIKPPSYFNISKFTERDKLNNRKKDLRAERDLGMEVLYIDKQKVIKGDPIEFMSSASIVSPYETPDYHRSPHKKWIYGLIQNSVGEFQKGRIRAGYRGF